MKCLKCQHENREGAKFCRKCGAPLERICSQCKHHNEPDAVFCDECGAKLIDGKATPSEATIPRLEDMHAQLQSLIPDELARKYMSAEQKADGENRPITALFADISGFTPLSNTQSSETMFQLVQDCFRELVGIVARYEGSISGFRGDGLLALFGAPILHENDAERAILTAMDMRRSMQEQQLQVSIGINTAMMTVGEIQTQLHREYTAYGTDVNLAKRLQEAAQPGQILVGTGTHRLTRRIFDFELVSDLSVKGFTEPVTAYSVQQVKEHPEKLRGIEGLRARMIGREHEFAELKEAADEWLTGQGQMVSIIGEAGIGKSRLARELRDYLANREDAQYQCLEGRCVSIGQPISYWPFLDILRTYFGLGEDDDERTRASKVTESIAQLMPQGADETLPLLGNLLSIKFGNELDDRLKFASPEQIRHQTLMRLRDLFETLARQQPLLLTLEDLHWADDLSLDLISLLMDELANTPMMLLCVYRPEKEHRVWQLGHQARRKCLDRYSEITLQPLSSHQSRLLVESLLEIENLPESTKDIILTKSEGNPFFIEEVIRSLIEQDLVYLEDDRWVARDEVSSISVPDTIQSVVLARVDRLQAEAKYVLQCASVIGRLFRYRILRHISQQEQKLDNYLSDFESKELVHPERTVPELEYAFKHAFTQEATYEGILEQRRREFHYQVARGIERLYQERLDEYYEELAYHYSRSDDTEKAVDYLIRAGDRARRLYANAQAIAYLGQALDLVPDDEYEKHYAILLSREQIYDMQGKRNAQRQDLECLKEQAEALKDDRRLAEVFLREANYAQGTSDYPAAIDAAQEAIEWAQAAGDKNIEAAGYLEWGQALWRGGMDLHAARSRLEHAVSLAQTGHLPKVQADSLRNLGNVLMGTDELCKAEDCYRQALQICREIGYRQCEGGLINNLGLVIQAQGDYVQAKDYFEQALQLDREIGDRWREATALMNIGFSFEHFEGDYVSARLYYEQSLRVTREIDDQAGVGARLLGLGSISIAQSNYAQAEIELEESLLIGRETGNSLLESQALRQLGHIYLAQGDYVRAKAHFDQSLCLQREIGSRREESLSLLSLADVHKIQGDYAGARCYYEEALHIDREIGYRQREAVALSKLSRLFLSQGDYVQAREYCERSLNIHRETGNRRDEGWELLRLGHIDLAQGNYTGAGDYYEKALQIFREIGSRGSAATGLFSMGLVSRHLGDNQAACQYTQEALRLSDELGNLRFQGEYLNLLGRALVNLGELAEAAATYRRALTICRESGQIHKAMESLAGLAEIGLAQRELTGAQAYVEEILDHIEMYKLDLLEPFRVYLICYRVLNANQDFRAQGTLHTAYRLLQERASRIADGNLRQLFLGNVAAHREIRSAAEEGE